MANQRAGIDSLPNEIVAQVLITFSTRILLPLAPVSHRFHDLIVRILHRRLLSAASLQDRKLILECFHPSAKLTTPGLLCDYIGTDGFDDTLGFERELYRDAERTGRLGKLAGLYSHFRPVGPEENRRPLRRRYLQGDVPGAINPGAMFVGASATQNTEIPSQIVSLESHELFSQLCTIANLVKTAPQGGFILSCVTIGEGVIRVWRDWLAERALLPVSMRGPNFVGESSTSSILGAQTANEKTRMLWLDNGYDVGIRVRVIERYDLGTPILVGLGEDAYVSYSLEYEELVMRTTQLLLKVEESILLDTSHSRKAIVIGTFTM